MCTQRNLPSGKTARENPVCARHFKRAEKRIHCQALPLCAINFCFCFERAGALHGQIQDGRLGFVEHPSHTSLEKTQVSPPVASESSEKPPSAGLAVGRVTSWTEPPIP
jgi:hypothetical protein